MSEIIYGIIKDDETSKLRKITESTYTTRSIKESELCKSHDYSFDLYDAYCSSLPKVDVGNNGFIPQESKRREAVMFEDAIDRLTKKYKDKLIAHSHRYGGWNTFVWKFNDDIKFIINTNFGYGSNSYFEQSVYYKGLKLAPYSKLVKYRYAHFISITSHTYSYQFIYSEWDKLMSDALSFYNAVVDHEDNYIFHWLTQHLDKLVNELERYINASYCYFDNIIIENNKYNISYRTLSERVEGDDFWIAKSNKISEALLFIDNISELPIQVDPEKYVNRIRQINETFFPLLEDKIESLKNEAKCLQENIDTITNEMPYAFYIKLFNKYYYKKRWYFSENKYSMIKFLMTILRRKSDIPNSKIRVILKTLDKQIQDLDEFQSKLNKSHSTVNKLSEYRDNIVEFFNSKVKTEE